MKDKMLKYKNYHASVNFSIEDECLYGKVEFINDSIVFGADTIPELKKAFEEQIDEYIEFCREIGKEPEKPCSGSFNVRVGEDLHRKALIKAKSEGVQLNVVVTKAIDLYVNGGDELLENYVSNLFNFSYGVVRSNLSHRRVQLSGAIVPKPKTHSAMSFDLKTEDSNIDYGSIEGAH